MDNTRIAYSEIYEILQNVSDEYRNRIPQKLMEFFKNERDESYKVNIDFSKPLEEQNLKRETITGLAMINYDYWCDTIKEKEEFFDLIKTNSKENIEPEEKIENIQQAISEKPQIEKEELEKVQEVEEQLEIKCDLNKEITPEYRMNMETPNFNNKAKEISEVIERQQVKTQELQNQAVQKEEQILETKKIEQEQVQIKQQVQDFTNNQISDINNIRDENNINNDIQDNIVNNIVGNVVNEIKTDITNKTIDAVNQSFINNNFMNNMNNMNNQMQAQNYNMNQNQNIRPNNIVQNNNMNQNMNNQMINNMQNQVNANNNLQQEAQNNKLIEVKEEKGFAKLFSKIKSLFSKKDSVKAKNAEVANKTV